MTVKGSGGGTHVDAEKQLEPPPPDSVSCSDEFLLRPSWTDARLALRQVNKGHAEGNRAALWVRAHTQSYLFHTGRLVQSHAGKILFVGVLLLATLCIGLKNIPLQTDVEDLWVEEGGRLQRELEYVRSSLGAGSGSLHQIVVQTPRDAPGSVLRPDALLAHLEVIQAASQVTVDMYDITWKLKDLCFAPSFPSYEEHLVDKVMEKLIPCSFVTPLDCFWEGSKLLGPDFPVSLPQMPGKLQWTSLDPEKVFSMMSNQFGPSFQFDSLRKYMKGAGITSGYQRRPCLNPSDPECPETASNRASGVPPDVGAELTGGCYGFATRHMHWPEQLIVGGTEKNRTGHITRAAAFQTVIQLMGEKNLFEFWAGNWKTHNMDWNMAMAKSILDAWQVKFSEEVKRQTERQEQQKTPYRIHSYSMESLDKILQQFATPDMTRLTIGYGLMLVYGFFSLVRWSDPVRSQGGLGVAGVLLVTLSVTAGLGLCGLAGIPSNASTTQIIPFLALGLGVDDMFLLALTYSTTDLSHTPPQDHVGEVLKRAGVSVLLTSLCNVMAFLSAAILPIPALRHFSLQAGILVLFNVLSILFIFPAMLSLDLRRRRARAYDIVCCWSERPAGDAAAEPSSEGAPRRAEPPAARPGPPPPSVFTITAPPLPVDAGVKTAPPSLTAAPAPASARVVRCSAAGRWLDLPWLVRRYYSVWLLRRPVRLLVLLASLAAAGLGVWGAAQLRDGLDLTDVVPRGSDEFAFLEAQRRYFGFFEMVAVTQGDFEYPTNQELLHQYHQAFTRVPSVIKNDDGGLPDFWLALFRDWLIDLQSAFDRDWRLGLIDNERWHQNASEEGVLAYKLLVQTGRVDDPINKSQLPRNRLVENGIINPKAFYNYLTAWASNDALAYSASGAQLRPEPKQWLHVPGDVELLIPKSQALVYAQIPFALSGLSDTEAIVDMIAAVRRVCRRFEERGLPNFPAGVPFTFWEQYASLRFFLGLALVCVFAAVTLVLAVTLMSVWAAAVAVAVIGLTLLQLLGVMGLLGLRLSAIPATVLIMAVGLGVQFTVHVLLGFQTSLGDRATRVQRSLEQMFQPVFHGAISTFVGVLMLAFSDFDFIVRYFFCVLASLVLLGLVNGLAVLPVLLCWLGPPAEVRPRLGGAVLPAPSPEPSPPRVRGPRVYRSASLGKAAGGGGGGGGSRRLQPAESRLSLSTISEESSGSAASGGRRERRTHDIVVEPRLVVETCYPDGAEPDDGRCLTTKVTATTHVKVEVHTPECGTETGRRGSRRARATATPPPYVERRSSTK
ncbi:Protein patched [Amphibalanus amphitrite]|uniref:Protein patched n=1 Tax=Amphibalanus amphitrite TaxID=1232801 RepID=A0A6A4VXR7_AMPAM|nr:Protein patched [Amphibalanus amphitrite]